MLNRRAKIICLLRRDIGRRIINENLGQLALLRKGQENKKQVIGEVVLVAQKTQKTLEWPMGVVQKLIMGSDETQYFLPLKAFTEQCFSIKFNLLYEY